MLCLQCDTNSEWIEVAVEHPLQILIDHAHCEKKAAAFALAMITRYPQRTQLVHEMTALAKEEIEHFEIVIRELERRNLTLTHDAGNRYAQQLHEHIRSTEPHKLLDSLIVGAFIEARSCERFSLLAQHIPDQELRTLYTSLFASEAGHYRTYTDIARAYFSNSEVKQRLEEFGVIEAKIVKGLSNEPTMHG